MSEFATETGYFISEGNKLNYRIVLPKVENAPSVLLLHGSSTTGGRGKVLFEGFQGKLSKNGFASMAFDTRGVDQSQGEYFDSTLAHRLKDAQKAHQVLYQSGLVATDAISLFGVSMGGHVVAELAGMFPGNFRKLILANPAAYGANAEDKRLYPYDEFTRAIREEGSWKDSLAFAALRRFSDSTLLLRSEFDQVVPKEVVDQYMTSGQDISKVIIPGVPHIFLSGTDEASETARQFVYSRTIDFLKGYYPRAPHPQMPRLSFGL